MRRTAENGLEGRIGTGQLSLIRYDYDKYDNDNDDDDGILIVKEKQLFDL